MEQPKQMLECPDCGAKVEYSPEVTSCTYCGHVWGNNPLMFPFMFFWFG